jgi:hypothetical protein
MKKLETMILKYNTRYECSYKKGTPQKTAGCLVTVETVG